jgi:hypothetical protein
VAPATGRNSLRRWLMRRLEDGSVHHVLKNFPTEAELKTAIAGIGDHPCVTLFEYYWAFEFRTAT